MKQTEVEQIIARTLASQCASSWLKDALRAALNRDCLDASEDAHFLADILSARTNAILGGQS